MSEDLPALSFDQDYSDMSEDLPALSFDQDYSDMNNKCYHQHLDQSLSVQNMFMESYFTTLAFVSTLL